jgi:hypothetical protein
VVDLSSSSDEGDLIANVSWDEEFTRRLFDILNRDVLGPLSDGKIIILNDSDEEEEEVHEEKTIGAEDAATSAVVNPTSTTSADVDDAPTRLTVAIAGEMTPGCLRLLRQQGT